MSESPGGMSGGGSRQRAHSDSVASRPGWDDRHHLLFARENRNHPLGQRDFFDRPRDLRICVPHGHDGISTPYERRPSLHWLKYHESPKMQRIRSMTGGSSPTKSRAQSADWDDSLASPGGRSASPASRGGLSPTKSRTMRPGTSPGGQLDVHHHILTAAEDHPIGVGSPPASPAKPTFQKTGSWNLELEKMSSSQKRENKYSSTHYSEKHGNMRYKERGCKQVPWNNRWQVNPSNFGQALHGHFREYFDNPSRMYTSGTEDWRHMYGDGCENLNVRTPGQPFVKPVYGWHSLRVQNQGPDQMRNTR